MRQARNAEMLEAAGAAARMPAPPEDGSSSDELPDTMLRPRAKQPRRRREHRQAPVDAMVDEDALAAMEALLPGQSSQSKVPLAGPTKQPQKEPKRGDGGSAKSKDNNKKTSNAASSRPSRARGGTKGLNVDDDDEIFEATLQQYAQQQLKGSPAPATVGSSETPDDGISGGATATGTSVAATSRPPPSIGELLTADRQQMDPRIERMKSFGAGSVESLKPQHPRCPRFKPCSLATPDPNKWPAFDALGARLEEATLPGLPRGITAYQLNTNDSGFQEGSRALHTAIGSGDPMSLMSVIQRFPYHLPALVQTHRTMATMGDAGIAAQMLDMALFTAGCILSPVLGRPGTQVLLLPGPGTTLLLEVLKLGVHSAMRKGCARTALELTKQLLSLDSADSQRMLLVADYIALRACAWDWTVSVLQASLRSLETAAPFSVPVLLPSWSFNAALAAHMRQHANASAAKAVPEAPQHLAEFLSDGGAGLLRAALLRYPTAGVAIADRSGAKLSAAPFSAFVDKVLPVLSRREQLSNAQRHALGIFAERSVDLWKMPIAVAFLNDAVGKLVQDFAAGGGAEALAGEQARHLAHRSGGGDGADEAALLAYRGATVDEALGNFTGPAIPRELLAEGFTEEEQIQHFAAAERAALPEEDRLTLDRFEAAFGPLPPDVPMAQRFSMYEELLQVRVRELGRDESAVGLFLRTLLPWNTARQIALRRALETAGREDPAVVQRRLQRARDAENEVEFVEYPSDEEEDHRRDP
jgi:Arc/MetJ family transcription regulator